MRDKLILGFEGARPGADARALIAQLKRALEQAEENAEQLGTLRVLTTRLPEGQEPTATVEYLEDEIRITLGIPDGATGPRGEAFTYDDFTAEQLESLRGPRGLTGEPGQKGETGKAFTYDDFTPEQLEALKGEPGKDGENGDDGYSPTAKVEAIDGGYRVTITDRDGPKTFDVMDGKDGRDGQDGKDGTSVTVASVSESTADGGTNVVTFSDGKKLNVKNGSKGSEGAPGYTPQKNVDYFDGKDGKDGKDGQDGQDGVSATHAWNGTVLSITSASGTSSADLRGERGLRGEKGETGAGFKVLDTFVSQGALELAVPNPKPGDAYGVGLEEPYDIYIYGETTGWTNHGKLQGAQGPQGEPGKDFTYNDFTAEQLENLRGPAGKDGSEGKDGATFTPSVDSSGNLSWTNNGGLQNPTTRNIRGPAGANGENATINGVNALTLEAEGPLALEQTGNTAKLRITGDVGGTTVIMSENEPSDLNAGDDWDQILTALEAPEEMFSYKVTLVGGVGYTVAAAAGSTSPVPRGESFRFTVTIANGYIAGAGFAVKANGTTLSATSGVYTISNINADQTVTVEGVVEAPKTATLSITGTGDINYCYATINGTKRYGAASNIEVTPGGTITFGVYGRSTSYRGTVTIDSAQVLSVTNQQTQTYAWTVPDGTKTISINMSYTSSSYQRRGTITVTTTK